MTKPARRIVTFNHVSADGYFSRPDGSLSWVIQDSELDRSVATTIERSKRDEGNDTLLLGRRTYEQFEARTRQEVAWKNSRLLHEINLREIEALKAQPGKDIMIFGSGSVVSQLTQHGLIDEYQFIVGPRVLGSGRQLITGVPQSVKLDLLEAKAYASGNVKLRYARSS